MASNGLNNRAKTGTCRMCQRRRNTELHLKIVGEINHGFGTGHIWECNDINDCETTILKKLNRIDMNGVVRQKIVIAQIRGRFAGYVRMT
jgi:hypothetical protein